MEEVTELATSVVKLVTFPENALNKAAVVEDMATHLVVVVGVAALATIVVSLVTSVANALKVVRVVEPLAVVLLVAEAANLATIAVNLDIWHTPAPVLDKEVVVEEEVTAEEEALELATIANRKVTSAVTALKRPTKEFL